MPDSIGIRTCYVGMLCLLRMDCFKTIARAYKTVAHLASRMHRARTDTLYCHLQFLGIFFYLPFTYHFPIIQFVPLLDAHHRCHHDHIVYRH